MSVVLACVITMIVKSFMIHKDIIIKNVTTIYSTTVMLKKLLPLQILKSHLKFGKEDYLHAIKVAKFAH